MSKKGIEPIIFVILGLNEMLDAYAQYCFKRAADTNWVLVSNLVSALKFVQVAFSMPYVWLGVAAVSLALLSWTTVLSKVDLSVASPITSLSYVFVGVASAVFLGEHVSVLRWTGIGLILLGVWVVSSTHERQEERV